jgi:glyoxylase-like metal-dependent hydrolase (beta-lactamase superfamily II)
MFAQGDFGSVISIAGNAVCPAYVIKGSERTLMIDAGVNLMGPLYIESIERILGDRNRLDYAFVTHSHYDHLGSIPYLKRKIPGLKAGAFERVGQLLKKESVLQRMRRLSEVRRDDFTDIVGDEDVRLEPVEFDIDLKEGDRFDLGDVTCEVYEVPGHTRDSLAFYIPEQGALFAGEACGVPEGKEGDVVQVEFLSSYDEYLRSIEKMMALKPRLIGMAHIWVFTDEDATEFLEKSRRATPPYRRLIESYLDGAGGDREKTLETMVRREYDEKKSVGQERNAYIENLKAQIRHIADIRG